MSILEDILWHLATQPRGKRPWCAVHHSSLHSLKLWAEALSSTVSWLCSFCHEKCMNQVPRTRNTLFKFQHSWFETFLFLTASYICKHHVFYSVGKGRPFQLIPQKISLCLAAHCWHVRKNSIYTKSKLQGACAKHCGCACKQVNKTKCLLKNWNDIKR